MRQSEESIVRLATDLLENYATSRTNVDALFYAIRTHKCLKALAILLEHPVYKINRRAELIAKIFKKQLKPERPCVPSSQEYLRSELYLSSMLESADVEQLYQNFHALNLDKYCIPKHLPNKKLLWSDLVFSLFKADCTQFEISIEAVLRGDEQPPSSRRVLQYISFIYRMIQQKPRLVKSAQRFIDEYQKVMLEIYYPQCNDIAFQTIVKTFHLEVNGKLSMSNLNYDKTRFGRLSAAGRLADFLHSDLNVDEFKQKLRMRISSVDAARLYAPEEFDSVLVTSEMMFYMAQSVHEFDFPAIFRFIESGRTESGHLPDLLLSFQNVMKIRHFREANSEVAMKAMHAPIDALLYIQECEKIEAIPLIGAQGPLDSVECALFNSTSRFFSTNERFSAIEVYLLAGFVLKDLGVASRAFTYFAKVFQGTSSASERESLRSRCRCDLFYLQLISTALEKGVSVDSALKMVEKALLVLFDSGAYYENQIVGLPQKLVEFIITDYQIIGASESVIYEVLQYFAGLRVANNRIVYRFGAPNTISLLEPYFKFYSKHMLNTKGVVTFYSKPHLNKEKAVELYNELYAKEVEYAIEAFDTLFFCKCKYLEAKFHEEATKEEIVFIDMVEELYPQLLSFQPFESAIQSSNFLTECKHQNLVRHIMEVIFNVDKTEFNCQDNAKCGLVFCGEAKCFNTCLEELLTYVKKTYNLYTNAHQHYEIGSFKTLHNDLLKMLHAIFEGYDIRHHDEIVSAVETMCRVISEFEFLNADISSMYESYYQLLFKSSTEPKHFKPRRYHDPRGGKNERNASISDFPLFEVIVREFKALEQNVPASRILELLSAMMKFEKLTPFSIYLATKMQQTIAIDKHADITILFENKMPMSSLKILIKFLFKNTEISPEYINKLFSRSSTDGKATILLYFYESIIENNDMKELFMQLIVKTAEQSPDAFLLFFGQVFDNEDRLNINDEIFRVCVGMLIARPSPYLLNFAGFLGVKLELADDIALDLFQKLVEQNKQAIYLMRYMLQIPLNLGSIENLLEKVCEAKHPEEHILTKTIMDSVQSTNCRFFNKALYFSQLTSLCVELLRWNYVHELNQHPCIAISLEHFSAEQLLLIFTHYALSNVTFALYESMHQWEQLQHRADFAQLPQFVRQVIIHKSGGTVDFGELGEQEAILLQEILENAQ